VNSNMNIGYQAGSFVKDYLLQLNVPADRLIALGDQTAYANALGSGMVGAIVDELPYIDVFLANECQYTIAGQEFTKSGWGFAFPIGSQLAVDISTAILQMSENGHLQQLTDYYLNSGNCGSSSGSTVSSNDLGLDTFWGLFLITGAVSVVCVLLYYARLIRQHHKQYKDDGAESDLSMSRSDRRKSFLRSLVTYIEEAEIPARQRDDAVRANNSTRKGKSSKKNDLSLESGGSARSEDPGLNSATTPEHPINPD
jgi:ionotropic glutamate receptor